MCASYPPALNPAGRQAHPTQHAGGTGLQNYTIDRGNYVEVAGARHYKLEIQRALGEKAKVSFNDEVECQLIPEVDNPYDPNAIAIKVRNLTIGYLPAEIAADLSPIVKRLIASRYIPATSCRISWQPPNRNYDSDGWVNAGVILPDPHLFLPINDAPPNSTLLPPGRSAQVIGEEDHFDMLFDYVPQAGEAHLYLELRLGTKVLKKLRTWGGAPLRILDFGVSTTQRSSSVGSRGPAPRASSAQRSAHRHRGSWSDGRSASALPSSVPNRHEMCNDYLVRGGIRPDTLVNERNRDDTYA